MLQNDSYDPWSNDGRCGSVQKVWAAIFAAAAVLLIVMQLVYSIYNEKSGYEYIADWMLYAVNAVILVFAFLYAFLMLRGKKTALLVSVKCTPKVRQYDILKITLGVYLYAKRETKQAVHWRI